MTDASPPHTPPVPAAANSGSRRRGPDRMRSRPVVSTGLLFAVSAAIVALSPVIYIPLVTGALGSVGFQELALGQSIGAGAAVIVGLGWVFAGPVSVARADERERGLILREALASQAVVASLVALPAAAATFLLTDTYRVGAALIALVAMLLGAWPTWYLIGEGGGVRLIVFDACPKLAGAAAGGVAVLLVDELWVLPVAQLLAISVALAGLLRTTEPSTKAHHGKTLNGLWRTIRSQASLSVAQIGSSVYMNLPLTLLAAVGAPGLATFAAADRYLRLSAAGLSPMTQTFQSWTPRLSPSFKSRLRTTLWAHAVVGVVAFPVLVLATPLVELLLFRNEVDIPSDVAIAVGATLLVLLLNRGVGVVALPALDGRRSLAVSATVGAVVGAPAIILLGLRYGALGGALGVLIAELVVLMLRGWAVMTRIRALPPTGTARSQADS